MAWLSRNFIYFNGGTTYQTRCQDICRGCAQALIRCGWLLDTDRHTDISDFKSEAGGTNKYAVWYYLKSRTGAKLLVYYNYYNKTLPTSQVVPLNSSYSSSSSYNTLGDLCLAIIPPGSTDEFGNSPTVENPKFVPTSAGYAYGGCALNSYFYSVAYYNIAYQQEWVFVSDGETIFTFAMMHDSASSVRVWPCYAIGKVLDVLANPLTDNLPTSKYGVFALCANDNGQSDNGNHSIKGNSILLQSFNTGYLQGSSFCFMPDGTPFQFSTGSISRAIACNSDEYLVGNYCSVSYQNGQRRWCPLSCYISQSNPATGQTITTGDGFKGYYDTDILRYVGTNNLSMYQLLDGGRFMYMGGGLAIAWDASNIVLPLQFNSNIDTRDENNE